MAPRADVEARLDAFAEHGEALALVHHDRRTTHGELRDAVYRTARALDARGIEPGSIVALLAGNSPEAIIARWAVNLLGAGATQPHEGLSPEARARIVDDVDAALVLVDPRHASTAPEVLAHARPVDVLGLGTTGPWPDLLELAAGRSTEPVTGRSRPRDVQQIRHTGGTTGHPKGISYTFGHHVRAARVHAAMPYDREIRMLVATPVAHAGGGFSERLLATGRTTVVLQEGFDAGAFLAAVERERITDSWLLPPLIYRLLDHPDLDATDLSSLQVVVYGGAPANAGRMAEAVRRIGPVFLQVYGQTEAGGISMLTPEEHEKPELLETVGRPIPSTDIAIRDDDGAALPDGARGHLWVHTGTEMDGYWKQPELTAATISDGWVRTGDIGFLDDAGYLHLVDRASDVVVVVGGHVYTSELEDTLMEHDGVRQAAVFGVPDPDGVETVHAAVVPGGTPDEDDLAEYVAERNGRMYVPSAIDVVDELPLTDIGKTDKKALRAQLAGDAGSRPPGMVLTAWSRAAHRYWVA